MSARYGHSLAIGSEGKLCAWGDNATGQLGDGGTTSDHSPEVMTLAAGVTPTAIAGGYEDTLAIGSDGHLYAWENNANGELGDCTSTQHNRPEVISVDTGVTPTAIAAGNYHSLAIGSFMPPSVLPESPVVLALPAAATVIFGAAAWKAARLRNRDRTPQPTP
jgi:alpha-tubulin suppressor-like RCC1 family protein